MENIWKEMIDKKRTDQKGAEMINTDCGITEEQMMGDALLMTTRKTGTGIIHLLTKCFPCMSVNIEEDMQTESSRTSENMQTFDIEAQINRRSLFFYILCAILLIAVEWAC